tara:strand:- start:612 stop:1031 length:420 start_codon:yes stop_codon:yes gene_type:complete
MKRNYLGNSHNKVFIKNKVVYKFYKSDKKYFHEKYFFLNFRMLDYIPKLLCFSDSRRLLIFNNVGKRIKKKNIDFIKLKKINEYFIKNKIYHNDYRCKNILYNESDNLYYYIDFEYWDHCFTDYRKSRESDDLRNELFN